MDKNKRKERLRAKRHRRVRKHVAGTEQRPRMSVFRSNKHIYVQVIDDWSGRTLLSCSSLSPELRDSIARTGSVEGARIVGETVGRMCVEKGIKAIAFDRGGYRYHGRVKALAEAARQQFKDVRLQGF